MTNPRTALVLEYAEVTRALRVAAQAGEVGHVAKHLCTRQRLIDEIRSLDATRTPLPTTERRALEAALRDDQLANEALERRRGEILSTFRTLAKTRRAHNGYASLGVRPSSSLGRQA
jgi:hypothetical protein